jgi:hypothetical protein
VSSFEVITAWPETHTKRQATQHGCLSSLLCDGEKRNEIVSSEEKYKLYWADYRAAKVEQKISCTGTTSPTKEGPLSCVLFDSPFTSVSTVSRGNPSLVSLGLDFVREEVHFVLLNRFEFPHSKLYQKLPSFAIAASYNAEVIITVFSGS